MNKLRDLLTSDIVPIKKTICCNDCEPGIWYETDEFYEAVTHCKRCNSKNIDIKYHGLKFIASDAETESSEQFDWDDEVLGIIEEEMNLEEGEDFIRNENGFIECITENAKLKLMVQK